MAVKNDYRVTVKVRNNNIIEAIENMGEMPGAKWCEKYGFSYHHLVKLMNMSVSPVDEHGVLKPFAERFCEITYSTPDELWCEEQLTPLKNNKADIKMSKEQVKALMWADKKEIDAPENAADKLFIRDTINTALESLTSREREVLRRLYGLNCYDEGTLDEVGRAIGGVSRERVRQIEAKALRKLRHPSRIEGMKKYFAE